MLESLEKMLESLGVRLLTRNGCLGVFNEGDGCAFPADDDHHAFPAFLMNVTPPGHQQPPPTLSPLEE